MKSSNEKYRENVDLWAKNLMIANRALESENNFMAEMTKNNKKRITLNKIDLKNSLKEYNAWLSRIGHKKIKSFMDIL